MSLDTFITRLYDALIAGDRPTARAIVDETFAAGFSPEDTVCDILWSVYDRLEEDYRTDKVPRLRHQMATRLLRMLADQTAMRYTFEPATRREVFSICGPSEADELSGSPSICSRPPASASRSRAAASRETRSWPTYKPSGQTSCSCSAPGRATSR